MNLLLLLGIGAAVLALSSSKSKSSSSSTETKEEKPNYELVLGEINPSNGKSGSSFGIGGIKSTQCNEFQYQQGNQCIEFWNIKIAETIQVKIIGKADQFRKIQIIDTINKGLNEPLIAAEILLCQDGTRNEIVKSSILETYTNIKSEDLPPTKSSPYWIKKVWELSLGIYNQNICKK